MKLNESKYKSEIGEFFDYSLDWDFLDIIANILERVEEGSSYEQLYNAIDEEMCYTQDQWTVMMFYQTPQEASLENAFDSLYGDVCALARKLNLVVED